MATTVEELQARMSRLENDLTHVKSVLRSLGPNVSLLGNARPDSSLDRVALLETFTTVLRNLGVDPHMTAPTPEELQRIMLDQGVDPVENLLSHAIIEMREE